MNLTNEQMEILIKVLTERISCLELENVVLRYENEKLKAEQAKGGMDNGKSL